MDRIRLTLFTDPGCPWGYSATPALTALRWRYGRQLDWRIVMIGLAEDPAEYEERGFTPLSMAHSQLGFRRFGMPFAPQPKLRVPATSLACRAVIAVRRRHPHLEWAALRALQFAQFCTPALLDEPGHARDALARVPGIDPAEIVAAAQSPEVLEDYECERAEARRAAGTPAEAQGKTAGADGVARFTAPSLIAEAGGRSAVAGGFQSLPVYDALLANLRPGLVRRDPPEDLRELLDAFGHGLTTAEIAAVLGALEASELDPEGVRQRAEQAVLELAAEGGAARVGVGDGALWLAPGEVRGTAPAGLFQRLAA